MANTKVFLLVDTDNISDDTSVKKENSVIFYDNRGDRPGNGKEFDSKIDKAKKIIWKGKVMQNFMDKEDSVSDTVDIIKVEHTSGAHLLKKDIYTGNNTVVGEVKDDDEVGIENYEITIRVNRHGTYEEYSIDPKMHT